MKLRNTLRVAAIAAVAIGTAMTAACGGTGSSGSGGETLTVYSADGLATWYKSQFDKFTKDTGIEVNLVEAGIRRGGVAGREGAVQPAGRPSGDTACRSSRRPTSPGCWSPAASTPRASPPTGRPGRKLRADRQQRTELHRQSRRQPAAEDVGRPAGSPSTRASCSTRRPGRPATAPRC